MSNIRSYILDILLELRDEGFTTSVEIDSSYKPDVIYINIRKVEDGRIPINENGYFNFKDVEDYVSRVKRYTSSIGFKTTHYNIGVLDYTSSNYLNMRNFKGGKLPFKSNYYIPVKRGTVVENCYHVNLRIARKKIEKNDTFSKI